MADLADKSGSAGSNLVQGTGTATATFPMPGSVQVDVESVVATIDNTAGGATTATLVVRDSSGEVVATKRMGDTFPAGDTGTVTFSLRNSDSDAGNGIRFDVENVGDWLHVTANGSAVPQSGTIVFDAENADPVTGGRVTLYAGGVFGIIQLFSENSIDIRADGDCEFRVDGNYNCGWGTWQGSADTWQMNFGSGGTALQFVADASFTAAGTADFFFTLRSGGKLEVQDSLGNPILRVNEDGSLQGKTGKALTFNL